MDFEKIGIKLIKSMIYGLLLISIAFLAVDAVTGGHELRGIVFGVIMYGAFLGLSFGPLIIMIQFFDKTVVVPIMFILIFSFIEFFCIEEGYIAQYFIFFVPFSSILYLFGKRKNRNEKSKKTC